MKSMITLVLYRKPLLSRIVDLHMLLYFVCVNVTVCVDQEDAR